MKEIAGIHFTMEFASPAAVGAQFMAEQRNLAVYRAKKLQAYKDWADPKKREEIQAKQKEIEAASRKELSSIDAEKIAVRTGEVPFKVKEENA